MGTAGSMIEAPTGADSFMAQTFPAYLAFLATNVSENP
jgi:hypothetical protein